MPILIVAALGHAAIYIATRMSRLMNVTPFCLPGCHLYGFAGWPEEFPRHPPYSGAHALLTACSWYGKA